LEQTKLQNIPGILLQLDFQKAFNTIDRMEIYPKHYSGFFFYSESMQRWNSTFYSDFPSSVLNNGYSANTTSHLLTKGIRQGCPLCPYLFFLGVEHLAGKIRQGKEIQGINIFHRELKICR